MMEDKDQTTEGMLWECIKELGQSRKVMDAAIKRSFIVNLLLIALLAAGLYVFQSYDYTSSEITLDSSGGYGDAIYQSGEGNSVNGQGNSKDKEPN